MNLETVEDIIISKLQEISNVSVQSWPDNPADFYPTHPVATLLVRYAGSNYNSPPDPNNQPLLVQERTSQWVVTIIQKSLKLKDGHQGIYTILESVRGKLSGFTITGLSDASIMWPVSDGFVFENSGFWAYEMMFAFTFPESE